MLLSEASAIAYVLPFGEGYLNTSCADITISPVIHRCHYQPINLNSCARGFSIEVSAADREPSDVLEARAGVGSLGS